MMLRQSLVDELRRLEEARAQVEAAHRRRASDDTAVMLQYYGMELDAVGFIIRDRLWALILGRGEDTDGAQVQMFFTALTTQVQVQAQTQAEAREQHAATYELDEADIAVLVALEREFDDGQPVNDPVVHTSAPASPPDTPPPLPQQPAVLPAVVLDPLIVFPTVVTNPPLEV
jgi:hypothetical protein